MGSLPSKNHLGILMENPWEIFLGNRWTSDGKSGNHGHNVADSSILGHGCG